MMPRKSRLTTGSMAILALTLLAPAGASAWGGNAERLIASRAIDTLPPDLQPYFQANRDFILRHATDSLTLLQNNPKIELQNHVLFLDHYGKFPFQALPRSYKEAVGKFGRQKLEASGVLPWQIGVYSQKLTEAMRAGNWDQARTEAACLAGYVAEANDPFNTTENYDGHLSAQLGVNLRFSPAWWIAIPCSFPCGQMMPRIISDPTDHAFEACLNAHAWIENILLADRRARDRLDRFHGRLLRPFLQSGGRYSHSSTY